MAFTNRLTKVVSQLDRFPKFLQSRLQTLLVGKAVPLVGTAGLRVEELTHQKVRVTAPYRKKVGNHIGSLHAAAMALAAETCTGFVVGLNLPDDRLPLLKSMKIEYKKRIQGALHAQATLTPEQVEQIRSTEKGELQVTVKAVDDAGNEPIQCEIVWAWRAKK